MAHPHAEHRAHKVEHRRVSSITKGYAAGGAVHSDEREDKGLIRKMVKGSALKADGEKPAHRADKPHRKKGGRVNKGKGTNVNVIIGAGHQAPNPGLGPMGPVAAPPPPMPAAPPMRPPVAAVPPGPLPPPGMPAPPPPGIRASGGRTYARGGAVRKGTKVFEESRRLGTQVTHSPGKNDLKDIGRGKPITYATGGPVEHPTKGGMAPKLSGGAGGGEARIEKAKRYARKH